MNIWILNHYATNMFFENAGRHQSLSRFLVEKGHEVTIFCANTIHGKEEIVDVLEGNFIYKEGPAGVNYVFVKSTRYKGNGKDRIKNMYWYYKHIFNVVKEFKQDNKCPDVIVASSVHPLALVAGIKLGKKYNVPCVCEIRDLWPESLIAFNVIREKSILAKILYMGEHWIYKKANRLIFTMPGGEKYIKDRHWENKIDLNKVDHVNNGVDLKKFNEDKELFKINDCDLEDKDNFKIIYEGSIRTANRIDQLVYLAEFLQRNNVRNIKIIIYGDGDQRKKLEKDCISLRLDNIVFKGRVDKKYIPYILSTGDLNIAVDESNSLGQYGISWNKIFDYMASGKPVLVNYDLGDYNLISDFNFGIAKEFKSIDEFGEAVISMINLSAESYKQYSENAKKAAEVFDYKNLADKFEIIINKAIKEYS